MSTREVRYLVCDVCDRDERDLDVKVKTHRIAVDAVVLEGELCEDDLTKILVAFDGFSAHARRVPERTRVVGAKPFPGTEWRFSSHALKRLGERRIDPTEIIAVIDNPSVTRPGNASDLEIRERGRLKAVVAPERAIVVTVAKTDERDGDMVEGS